MLSTLSSLSDNAIIFGGLTLGLLSALSLVGWIIRAYLNQAKYYYNHTNQVIESNTKAWIENAKGMQKLATTNERLAKVIEKFHERNR